MKERLAHIDMAKAIGLIIIMTSHINSYPSLSESVSMRCYQDVIHSFYVPLFFILSGVFVRPIQNLSTCKECIKAFFNAIKSLIYVLLFFYIISIPFYYCIRGVWLFSFIVNIPLWFLVVLIIDKVLMLLLLSIKHVGMIFVLVLMIGLIGCYVGSHGNSYMYFGTAAACLPFMAFGYFTKDYWKIEMINVSLLFLLLVLWSVCFFVFFKPVELWLNDIPQNPIPMYVSAIAGSMMVIELCKFVKCSWLLNFGTHSIVPMCTHVPILYMVNNWFYPADWKEWLILLILLFIASYTTIYLFKNKYYNLIKCPF